MADIINLRLARKAKTRAEKERVAVANRARFGRTKAEREQSEKQAQLEAKRLDRHKLDD